MNRSSSNSHRLTRRNKRHPRNSKTDDLLRTVTKALNNLTVVTAIKPTPSVRDIPKMLMSPIQTFTIKQNYYSSTLTTSAATGVFGATNVTLNQLTLATSFQAVFDAYRFLQVTIRFVPLVPASPGSSNYSLLTVLDYDDSNVPTTTASLRAYDTLYESSFGQYHERTFVPRIALAAYSGTFTSYAQGVNTWCDIASGTVQWYGLKYGVDQCTLAIAAYEIQVDAVIQFKSVR